MSFLIELLYSSTYPSATFTEFIITVRILSLNQSLIPKLTITKPNTPAMIAGVNAIDMKYRENRLLNEATFFLFIGITIL